MHSLRTGCCHSLLSPSGIPDLPQPNSSGARRWVLRTFAFSENPEPLGLPTINDPDRYWEPVMSVANDTGMVVSMHTGSSSTMPPINRHSGFMANLTWGANRTSGAMLAWLFSGYFQAYPNLKIALSEGEVGWIPYVLERAEYVYRSTITG